jgi:ABC-2 type transport system permease protein
VRWLIAIFIVGPLLALMAVAFSVMVSSRVNDPRVAEQLSMLIILPVMGLFLGQLSGLFIINRQLILAFAVLMVFVDAVLLYVAVRLFQREAILTRWK